MKRRIIVAGICMGAWLCGSVFGQETVVTNLLVTGSQRQSWDSTANGDYSTAQGYATSASGNYSHAEGESTMANGTASHAEGGGTLAEGDYSHAEGLMTESLATNSHAGGAYAQVRQEDVNSFIHATGTTNAMKETQYPDTAHFDHIVTLEPALDASNAVLSRTENDARYATAAQGALANTSLQVGGIVTVASVRVQGNTNTAIGSAVAGGQGNLASSYAFVGGGKNNMATGGYCAIVGGYNNKAYGGYVSIGGGNGNQVYSNYSTIAGGYANRSYMNYSTVGGGNANVASNHGATVGGGYINLSAGESSTVAGGAGNAALGKWSSVGGGAVNVASGECSTVAGGQANYVSGAYGAAGGYGARAVHDGAWVWADHQGGATFASIITNEFAIRAANGVRITPGQATSNTMLDVTGRGRFSAGVLVPQQGDISMGSYTNGTF